MMRFHGGVRSHGGRANGAERKELGILHGAGVAAGPMLRARAWAWRQSLGRTRWQSLPR